MIFSRKELASTLLAGLFVALHSADLRAHDFWIEPSAYEAPAGTRIAMTLRVGMDFGGDSVPYINDWFSDYRAVGAAEEYPIEGIIGDDPAGAMTPAEPGIYVIGYRSTVNFVEMAPLKFEKYLKDEGLERISALRLENGAGGSAGREIYSRCAKSLIRIGKPDPAVGFDTRLGYTLELIPERNPYDLSAGDTLPVRLVYESEPMEGVLVIAFTSDKPADRLTARTDARGRVNLELPRAGIWLIKAVHMIPAPESYRGADWESFWASLTFRLPAR